MASFEKASTVVAGVEGGYSTNINDKGNYLTNSDFEAKKNFIGTNWGISAPTLAAWRGKAVTKEDMKALTYPEALKIFKKNYWDAIDGDKIKDQNVANILYDRKVNAGNLLVYEKVTGEKYSADSVNKIKGQEKFFNDFKSAILSTYAPDDPNYKGWVKRMRTYVYNPSIGIPGGGMCRIVDTGSKSAEKEKSKKCHFKSITLILGDEEDKH